MDHKDLDLIWTHTHKDCKKLNGCSKQILVRRDAEPVWILLAELTTAEFTLRLQFALSRQTKVTARRLTAMKLDKRR